MLILLILSMLFSGFSSPVPSPAGELTTLIFVRHAETEEVPGDVDLNDEGRDRAMSLVLMLEEADITAVYSTPYNRTRQTAQAVAGAHGLSVREYDPRNPEAPTQMAEEHAGGTVVVAGHSNTTPAMVNRLLGEQRFEQLQETDYSNIFIVTVDPTGTATVLHLRY